MYSHSLCRLCVPGDFGELARAVAGTAWMSRGSLCWGHAGGKARAEVDVGWAGPGVLCTESTLAGQLKLKWIQGGPRALLCCR